MKFLLMACVVWMNVLVGACSPGTEDLIPPPSVETPGGGSSDSDGEELPPPSQNPRKMKITVGTSLFTAQPADNQTASAFGALLPITMEMGELNGNEKFYYLPQNLPTAQFRPATIHSGELMLYGSNCLVLFYKTFSSSYSYTPIGTVDNPSGLEAALGRGRVTLKIEWNE